MSFLTTFLILLALTLPLAHLFGRWLAGRHQVAPGRIREAMPSLPVAPPLRGRLEQRWDRQVDRTERRLIAHFKDGVEGARIKAVAAELGLEPMLVEAAMGRMREEVSCRLRVLRSGELLHDFDRKAIAQLRRARRAAAPIQALLTALAALANLGAAWPFLAVGGISAFALYEMATVEEMSVTYVGLMGIGLSVMTLGGAVVLSVAMKGALSPLMAGPRLGGKLSNEPRTRLFVDDSPSVMPDVIWWGRDGLVWVGIFRGGRVVWRRRL